MNERLEARVRGRVQMVMYRDFAARSARRLKLVGEVQNLSDGSVRVVAEGPRAALERFVTRLRKGSLLARVDDMQLSWKPAEHTYRSFTITYD